MKVKVNIIIASLIILLGCILLITSLYDKNETVEQHEEITTTEDTVPLSSTTVTTTTILSTTRKTTTGKIISGEKAKPGTKQEYLDYARYTGKLNDTQLQCLDYLWTRESNWNPNDVNKSSGACGIPQAYPCSKIKQSEGSDDWQAQIRWGLKYISARYKNPCAAWNHFKNHKWY